MDKQLFTVPFIPHVLSYSFSGLLIFQSVMPAMSTTLEPVTSETMIDSAGDGVPIVNIAPPDQAGISHNQYQHFNVGKEGVILNNATDHLTLTQLGGLIQNNPNLKPGYEASEIINEVIGANRSELQGFIEVAGKPANTMVANAYGITCDGCGFINIPQATLTTGKPIFDADGVLQALQVTKGHITIDGQGLNAVQTDKVSLIARATEINAQLHAKELKIITGNNLIHVNGSIISIKGDGRIPTLAIDTRALGGMYANRIKLISNENGVGVNVGNLNAREEDISLNSMGEITLRNTLSEGSLKVNGMQVSLTGAHKMGKNISISSHQDLTLNQATLSSGREISLMSKGELNVNNSRIAAGVDTSGMVTPQGKLKLKAKYQSLNNSVLTTDFLNVNAKQNFVQDNSSKVIGRERVNIDAKQININGSVSSGKNIAIVSQEMNTGSQSELYALRNLNIDVDNDAILNGKVLAAQDLLISGGSLVQMGRVAANRHHTVLMQKLNNQGQLHACGNLRLQSGMLTNSGHILSDLDLSISSQSLQNSGSIHGTQAMVIQSKNINADKGSILFSDDDIRLVGNTVTLAGYVSTKKNFFVDSQVLSTQSSAKLRSSENMTINVAKQAEISGDILSSGHLLMVADSLSHLGKVRAKTIKIKSSTLTNRGQLTSFSDLTFRGSSLYQVGTMKALGHTSVFADTVNNYGFFESDTFNFEVGHHFDNTSSGIIHAESEINLRSASVDNTGKLLAKKLTVSTDSIDNNGLLRGSKILSLGTQTLNNRQKGELYSCHAFTLSTSQLINAGLIGSASGVVFKGGTLANSGEIHAGSLILENKNINNAGRLLADKSQTLTGNALINTGLLSADIVAITTSMITNTGTVQGKNGLSITAESLSHDTEGRIKSGSDLILTSTTLEALGPIVALGDVTLSLVRPFISKNILAAGKKLIIRGQGDVVNHHTMQGKSIHLDAGGTFRNQGKIQLGAEGSTFNAQRIKLEKNSSLQAGSDIALTSRDDISVHGFTGAQGSLTLHADSNIINTALLYAGHDIHLYSHHIKNQQGDILAGNHMWLQKDATGKANTEITNTSGSIETQRGNIVLVTQHLTNERQTLNMTRSEPVNLRRKYSWLSETAALIPITELELGVDYGYITGTASGGGGSPGHGAANCYSYAATSPLITSPPKEFSLSQCQQSVTAEGRAGRISAAQNISINAFILNNMTSSILAGKNLSIDSNTLKNQSYTAGTLTRYQTYAASVPTSSERVQRTLPNRNRYRFFDRDIRYVPTGAIREELVNSKIYRATIQAMGDIALQVIHQIGNTSVQANTGQSTTAMIAAPPLNSLSPLPVETEVAQQEIDSPDWNSLLQGRLQSIGEGMIEFDSALLLQDNTHDYPLSTESDSFFTPTPDPQSRYLIIANPKLSGLGQLDNSLFNELNAFLSVQPTRAPRETQSLWTDETQFYGSAYFMDRLKLSPDYDYRFLGDAAFDTRYISNAVLNHTGSRYLKGMGSDLAQMRSLIDNAARQQKALNLVFGVGLNARQIAALDGSIVWWESRTIEGKKVMIPKLYLSAKDTVVRNGSVIAGKNVRVTGGQIANEGSSLIARYDLDVKSQNSVDSMNLGLFNAGGNLKVYALGNINNFGSVINGKTVQLASMGGSINAVTPAYDWNIRGTGLDGQKIDFIHTQTGPQARIEAQDELKLMAGNSLTFKDSMVLTGGDLQMKAGGDIMMEGNTLTHHHQQSRTWRQPSSSRHRVNYQGTTVNAGGKVQAQAGNNITVIGSSIDAGDNTALLAGLTINLNAVETRDSHHIGGRAAHRTELVRTSLTTGGNLLLRAEQDINGQAAGLVSEQNITLQAQRDMNLLAKETRGGDSNHTSESTTINERIRQQGSEIVSEGNTLIHAGRDFKAQSADLVTQGYLGVSAGRDINLTTARESDYSYHENSRTSGGLLSKTTTHTLEERGATRSKGAVLCGDIVTVQAGNNILLQGASVISERDVKLGATRNIDIVAATNSDTSWQFSETHTRGLMSSGGIGFTLGSKKNTHSRREQGTTQSESFSTVGSTGGNALITAGQQVHMEGGDIIALQDITIRGDRVVVMPGHNKRTYDESYESKSSGLTVAISGIVGSAANNAFQAKKEIKEETDSRLATLKMAKAALSGVQSAQSLAVARISGDLNKALGVSLSLSTQKAKSTQHVESNTVAGSTISAGGHLAITATGQGQSKNKGDILIGGSQLKAGGDAIFLADNDIVLSGTANTHKMTGENNGSGGGVGVGFAGGTHGYGLSAFASTNASKGHNKGNSTTWTETTLDSGNMASITSGRDAVLDGALISSNKVVANIGQNLWMSSQQYSNDYHAKQNSIAAGGGFTFGSMTGSGNVSASEDKIKSTYHSVLQQTGIYTGKGGFDIHVGQHTQLDGAVIASLADKSYNRLNTSTLGFKDIHNQADFSVSHSGISLSGGGQFGGDMFKGHMSGGMISTGGNRGHATGTTQAAVAAGTVLVSKPTCQNQNIAQLSRDTEHANDRISPIFNKDKEQKRLRKIRIISELGSHVGHVAYAQGEINALALAREQSPNKSIVELKRTAAYRDEQVKYGMGSGIQRGIQTATAALQGLAGGNLTAALAGASAPQLANVIGHHAGIEDNPVAKSLAHAILGGVVATLQGNNVVAGTVGGASAELAAQAIISQLYPDKSVHELSESEKQTLSVLSSMAAGMAGGLAGDSTLAAATGAQSGKNTVENNFLGATSSDKLDKAIEKIKNGDKSLATANELIMLENADKRSDALVSKFTKDPSQMNSTERAELAGYLRVYASEMEKEYGSAVSQELVKGLLSGQDYQKRSPDSKAMSKAQSIMNTWDYHKSNASIGDAPLMFGGSVLGVTVKGIAANAAIGTTVNTISQLSGKDAFSYVDAIMAGVTAAATTGKSIGPSALINMGGAAVGSGIKGEDPTNSVIGAGFGSVAGSFGGKVITDKAAGIVKDTTADLTGAVGGSVISEVFGNGTKELLDQTGKKDEKK